VSKKVISLHPRNNWHEQLQLGSLEKRRYNKVGRGDVAVFE